ncbi:MAG: hypothetical protein AAF587_43460 [Bacteroidota bacterium]
MKNPIRRNRNIGTARQGYGQNNKNVISQQWSDDRMYWGKIDTYTTVEKIINGKKYAFIVEKTRKTSIFPCTVEDIETMISFLDPRHLDGLDLIVFRQPKRREETLNPVWGRLLYFVEIGKYSGPTIMLESIDFQNVIKWSRKLNIEDQKEFDRLIKDGHQITENKRDFTIVPTITGLRNTQLYRTFVHEVGHYVEYLQKVERPSEQEDDVFAYSRNWEKYDKIPSREKEDFAHRFAEKIVTTLKREGKTPFERKLDPVTLEQDGLNLTDFVPE